MSLDRILGQYLHFVPLVSWRKLVLLFALLLLGTSRPDAEATVIYSYTGQNFTFATPPYTLADKVTGSFSVADVLQPGLFDIEGLLLSYSFSDGVGTLNKRNSQPFFAFQVNAAGNIDSWNFAAIRNEEGFQQIQTTSFAGDRGRVGLPTIANVSEAGTNAPGSWSLVAAPQLSQAEKDLNKSRGDAAQAISDAAKGVTLLAALAAGSLEKLLIKLTPVLTSSPDTVKYLTYLTLVVAAVAAVTPGATLGTMALASVAIVGVFAGSMAQSHNALAADPPDPNFKQVAQYSNARPVYDFGLGGPANDRFAAFYSSFIRAAEATQFALMSLERLQGAIAAGDLEAAAQQRAAYNFFAADIAIAEAEAGLQAADFRAFLTELGLDDPHILGVLDETAATLQPTPEPATLLLLGTTMAGLGLAARWRRRSQK